MEIVATKDFILKVKRLAKKYASFKDDLNKFVNSLVENPEQGVVLSKGFRKIRLAITSKGKGKSGGARVITYNCIINLSVNKIVLVTVYDKSEKESINEKEINEAFKTIN